MCMKEKVIKIIKDFSWNIAATALGTAVLQLLIYPFLARYTSVKEYGELLTIIGVANIVVVSAGGGLNNTRLIQQEKYEDGTEGDFNLFLGIVTILGCISFLIISLSFFKSSTLNLIMLIGYTGLGIIRGYWSVAYRLKIDYVLNFKLNLFISMGYIVGVVIFKWTSLWVLPFLIAELIGVVYLYFTTSLYRERYVRTPLFNQSLKILIVLIINTLIGNVIIYLDRLVLYPILGGAQVSVFTVSSFVGKSVGILVTPISGVLLSYYAQKNFKMTIKRYWMINCIMLLGSVVLGGTAILCAPWITGLLYPTIISKAIPYLLLANGSALIGVLGNVISPAILKYADIKWQLIIQLVYIVLYFGMGMVLLSAYGLYGFCIANLLVNGIKVIILLVIGHNGVKIREE